MGGRRVKKKRIEADDDQKSSSPSAFSNKTDAEQSSATCPLFSDPFTLLLSLPANGPASLWLRLGCALCTSAWEERKSSSLFLFRDLVRPETFYKASASM